MALICFFQTPCGRRPIITLKIQICEHPLHGLPAYPVSSQHFVSRKKCFLTYQSYAASTFFLVPRFV